MRVFLAWYDFWIGAFYDRKKRQLYVCPLPCLVIQIDFSRDEGAGASPPAEQGRKPGSDHLVDGGIDAAPRSTGN